MSTLADLISASSLPPLEARVLVAHVLGVERAWLAAHSTDEIRPAQRAGIESAFARRRSGEPVAYITGEREFYGLMLAVSTAVLIPRPETELLVDIALRCLKDGDRVLDLGTGSGAIAIALAHSRASLTVVACDVSQVALEIARRNGERHGVHVELIESDWFSAIAGSFDVIVANPPYIASGDPHLEQGDLRFEPRGALESGPSGMERIEAIARGAKSRLKPGGWLLLEHGYNQEEASVTLLRHLGYAEVSDHRDLAGQPRVAQGRFDPPGTTR